jgi:hypothetical protein
MPHLKAIILGVLIGSSFAFVATSVGSNPFQNAEAATAVAASTVVGANCQEVDKPTALAALSAHNAAVSAKASQAGKKPNILVIWGDDIGTWNISHNNRGMMGYRTPNIDRIAREGVSFTD